MGTIAHNIIIVTGVNEEHATKAHDFAFTVFDPVQVSPLMQSPVNDYWSFMVGPDGSREGWEISDAGDEARAKFVEYLSRDDVWSDWAEVRIGELGTSVINCSPD